MKPYVICHMCTSIDGRIINARWGKLPVHRTGSSLFETTAASFDVPAWIVGTTTMKEFAAKPSKPKPVRERIPRTDFIANPNAKSLAIGVDAKAVLTWKSSEVEGDHVVLLLTQRASNAYLAGLRAVGVSYLFCGKTEVDLAVALDKLAKSFRLKKLMLEGGGKFNGSFLAAGLIDEISHVIVPVADGGVGVQTLFDIPGPAPKKAAAHLRLLSHKQLPGGVTWLRYRVLARR